MRSFWKLILKVALWVGGIALVAFGVLRLFFMDLVVMGHDGMAPTLIAGDEVFMWRGADDAEMGDIVVCNHPTNAGQMVMGRVLGKSNMAVRTNRGNLEVSGTRAERDIIESLTFHSLDINRGIRVTLSQDSLGNFSHWAFWPENPLRIRETQIPANSYYLLGDNRTSHANDSRTFGTIQAAQCVGTLFMRMKPAENARGVTVDRGWLQILD
ncbi:MAG: signal peptidase I [Myxococcota bacterium]